MKALGYIIATLTVIAFSITFSGFALSVLWGWFIVPTLGAPPLTIPAAIGITMVVSFLTHQLKANTEKKPWIETLGEGLVIAIIKPTFALIFGWVVSLFMA